MKKIYLLDKGDTINKISKQTSNFNLKISDNKLFNRNFIVLEEGEDDILLVQNYNPLIEYKIEEGETILEIMSRGFEIDGGTNVLSGDSVILTKPSSIRYVVKPTDTIEFIEQKFGVNKEDIIIANNLKTEKLFIGQVLWL